MRRGGQDKQEVKEDSKDDQTLYSTKRIDANTSPHGENRTKPVNVEKKEVLEALRMLPMCLTRMLIL